VVTTHYDRLKAYGYLHPDVENVAVEFDQETLEPKYTLSYGFSGLSNAFLVAEKIGIPEDILARARTTGRAAYRRCHGSSQLWRS